MKLYQGGCSYLRSPDIFEDTCLSEYFGNDLININNSKGGTSNTQIFRKAFFSIMKSDFDFVIIGWSQPWRDDKSMLPEFSTEEESIELLNESYSDILVGDSKYDLIYPGFDLHPYCKFEPQGTDDTIIYTIVLQQLLKSKNIPHLFITMGENSLKTLNARLGWLELIDSKNYYGEGSIVEKMNYSVTLDFKNMHQLEGYSMDFNENFHLNSDGYIKDVGAHLTNNAKHILADRVLKYMLKHNIIN